MFHKFIMFLSVVLLVSAASCGSKDEAPKTTAGSPGLDADYTESVVRISPSLSSAPDKALTKAITADGVTCGASTVLDNIAGDSDLYRQWVGWDNDNGGILSPSAPDGWMPYKEDDSSCAYVDEEMAGEYGPAAGQDDIPDLKNYAVLNKVFFGGGTDTIYGSAEFLDMMITSINEDVEIVELNPAEITLPEWFGEVYTDETTSTDAISLDNLLDIGADIDPSYGITAMQLGYSVNSATGEQVVVIFMQFAGGTFSAGPQVSMFYGRKDSGGSLYIKSSFIDFDSGNDWASSHKTELRTSGDDFIIRKANKILGDDSACCPLGSIYSHALIGGGNIATDSFFVLRWLEGRYDYSSYSADSQPTIEQMCDVITPVLNSAIYFIVRFDTAAQYNARFIPLYGKGSGGGATVDLPVNLSSDTAASSYFTAKPECAVYTDRSQFFTQSELPGWDGETIADFGCWTEN